MPPKPKLTPEERKQVRSAKKAERKRKLIEKKKQIKHNFVDREVKYGGVTIKRHKREWRSMLINIALPKMKEDLEYAWHNFERVIDCKNFTISLLMDELRDAELQYILNYKNHAENIDRIINGFHGRLQELKTLYTNEVKSFLERAERKWVEFKHSVNQEETSIRTMIFILEKDWKEQKQTVRAEYFSKIEEEETKFSSQIQKLRGVLEQVYDEMDHEVNTFLEQYTHKTRSRKMEHDDLNIRDDELHKLLVSQLVKLRKMCERVKRLKSQYHECKTLQGNKLKDVQAEYNYFLFVFEQVKMKLKNDRKTDFEQVKVLSVNFNSVIDYLQKMNEKGEHILQYAAVCRKLETQDEKIRPFPIAQGAMPICVENQKDYLPSLDLFFQRVGQVEVSRCSIYEEREYLKTENRILKMKLHRYCECVTCPGHEINNLSKGLYVTEGVLEMKKYDKHNNYTQFHSNGRDYEIDQ